MLFNSVTFLFFFPIVVILYFLIPPKRRPFWLLISSYYFYMSWNPKYALLIFTSTVVTYISGLLIDKANHIDRIRKKNIMRKICVGASFIMNISILFFYKYFNFTNDFINFLLDSFGSKISIPYSSVLLPVGISFYTFQALSYTMDVYRSDIKAETNFAVYALFVSFFPQLVAGPIERSTNLLPQFRIEHKFNYLHLQQGFNLIIWGFFKKMVVADRLSLIVDRVYDNPNNHVGLPLIIATFLFAFQIYCDFSSYSDIAIGTARIMGFKLMKNFDKPYFSKSIVEFWKKWHISLSTWFRDYLYFPLGGNRVSTIKWYRNILIVFIVSGLWHGASLNFVIWGILHAIFQIISLHVNKLKRKYIIVDNPYLKKINNVISVIITFILVDIAWIFFRAKNLKDSIYIITNLFTGLPKNMSSFVFDIKSLGSSINELVIITVSLLILFIVEFFQIKINIKEKIKIQKPYIKISIYLGLTLYILLFGYYGNVTTPQFLYFQF